MSELQGKFQDIVKRVEDRIKDKEELNFIKEQIAEISLLFMDQLDKVVDLNEDRLNKIIEREMHMEERIQEIENIVKDMQKEFYLDDNYDFEIVCPYCNYEFVSDFSQSVKEEIECPECHNIIELDWNNNEQGEECSGHCSCCEEGCEHDFEDDYDVEEDEFADYDVHEVNDMDEDIEKQENKKKNSCGHKKQINKENKISKSANSSNSDKKKDKMKQNEENNETKNDNDDDDM